jgi:hypothetical protein
VYIEIFVWELEVSFNKTWGSSESIALPPIDPIGDLKNALEADNSWGGLLPSSLLMVETLREIDSTKEAEQQPQEPQETFILLHPSGNLEIRQNVVPLGMKLEKYGNAPLTGHNCFEIVSIEINDGNNSQIGNLDFEMVQEHFARGQIINLSAKQKLSLPSFEKMDAGVLSKPSKALEFAGKMHVNDAIEQESVLHEYETILIKPDLVAEKATQSSNTFKFKQVKVLARNAASSKCSYRWAGANKFSTKKTLDKVRVTEEQFTVVDEENLTNSGENCIKPSSRAKIDMEIAGIYASALTGKSKSKVVPIYEAIAL